MTTTVTLTVPYAGIDRRISGSPLNIARIAMLIESGLPTLEDMNLGGIAHLCDDVDGNTSLGMGDGSGQEFVVGSHTLIMAIRHVMQRTRSNDLRMTSRPYGRDRRLVEARLPGGRRVVAIGPRAA